ncbi:DnaJ family domain-containing protein [Nitrogeniibacter aestuarii]|uniref:DnaJ family domain-containing protein n=1 Tax=Nitrogeniibacter aestuarii TaxID=2815343 RepID=UPI001D109A2C|nr:DnaJ family domain-containing protein [Nitrogeniibacter aestuarii]
MTDPAESERRKKRDLLIQMQDDEIGKLIARAYETGEIQSAESFGKPMKADGFVETPGEFRMPFKVLRNADAVPPEIFMFRKRAELREALEHTTDPAEAARIRSQLNDIEQAIALRLEGMRVSGRL